ncbi:DUF4430 domain-containing protein [Patescibacteria group bacterium]|nr:DUF4430 domain-containing protein [Patescibacteria group bacterium]MBU1074897.1 DUF4430 domain-containing protein [Patescibacteria group bacterium]MBU1952069.1 DUF4430 domain-containing protein [Patescibacteria group bacterium]
MIKRKIAFLFSLLLLLTVVGAGCVTDTGTQENAGKIEGASTEIVSEVKVDLTITIGEESTTYSTIAREGFSVLDILQLASDENDFELKTQESSLGVYVDSIAGKAGGDNKKYWMYYVNEESATVGVADYVIEDGDSIEFKFE